MGSGQDLRRDLDMTVKAIVDELGPADPLLAIERLLRFIATHQAVFERMTFSGAACKASMKPPSMR